MKRLLPLLAAALPLAAQAVEYNVVVPERSRVGFVSKQMGVPVEGGFGKFAAQIAFDPAKPEAGRAQIDLDIASMDAGSAEANDEVKSKAWFDTRQFPRASFVSTGVKALGGGRYEARGRMTIKGKTRDVVAPFGFKAEGNGAIFEGTIPVMRLQFGVGEGLWSDTGTVADEVQVKFRFTVAAGRK